MMDLADLRELQHKLLIEIEEDIRNLMKSDPFWKDEPVHKFKFVTEIIKSPQTK